MVLPSSALLIREIRPGDLPVPDGAQIAAYGLSIEADGRLVAVGGLVQVERHWWTFSDIKPEARNPWVLHRLVLGGLAVADRSGIGRVYGYCDETKPRARRWIEAIGFRLAGPDEKDASIAAVEEWCGSSAWIREANRGD
jgi:RimJ/RimL family protein N-acetyltransferase